MAFFAGDQLAEGERERAGEAAPGCFLAAGSGDPEAERDEDTRRGLGVEALGTQKSQSEVSHKTRQDQHKKPEPALAALRFKLILKICKPSPCFSLSAQKSISLKTKVFTILVVYHELLLLELFLS